MDKTKIVKPGPKRLKTIAVLLIMTVLLGMIFGTGTVLAQDSEIWVVPLDDTFNQPPPVIEGYTYIGWTLNGGPVQSGLPSYTPTRGNSEDVTIAYIYQRTPVPPVAPKSGK